MPLESCTSGHGASKFSRDPKTVDYSPRKRPEMPARREIELTNSMGLLVKFGLGYGPLFGYTKNLITFAYELGFSPFKSPKVHND